MHNPDQWWLDAAAEFQRRTARWKEPPARTRLPGSQFDDDFKRLVGPQLLRLIIAYAYHVQVGLAEFGEALSAVWAFARRRGAGYLSDDASDELRDWISDELVLRIEDAPPEEVLPPERVQALLRWRV